MRALHLDGNFKPCGYDIQYEKFKFPGGENHIRINDSFIDKVLITQVIRNGDDIMEIALAAEALRANSIEHIELFIPYIPYARQDRRMVYGEPLSAKVFARIINSLRFQKVHVFDPHSDVSPALIDNCKVINNHHFIQYTIKQLFDKEEAFYLVSPDAGADKKIKELARYLSTHPDSGWFNFSVIKGDKTRNVKTGEITGFEIYADDLKGFPCLIVDDICDGGGTFLGLADKLKEKNAGNLFLAVSHGIFSKGTGVIAEKFSRTFTTNSWYDSQCIHDNNVTQYQLSLEI